jgi:hydroxymethylpyrimidine pyrophosphatase-like HAD family hydrolase
MELSLLISDWEGCMADPAGGIAPWPLKALGLVRSVIESSRIPFALCTGRQFPYVEAALQCLGAIGDTPSVGENGCGLYYPKTKEVVPHPLITPQALEAMGRVRSRALAISKDAEAVLGFGKEFAVSLRCPPGSHVTELLALVQSVLADLADTLTFSHSQSSVDITPAGIDKGAGIRFLAEEIGVSLTSALAIGDSQGDLPMLASVGHPACPANADDRVKEIAEYVSPLPATEGVLDILDHYSIGS